MKNSFKIVVLASLLIPGLGRSTADRNFDANWRFLRADAPSAESPTFNDQAWRRVELPHDWSIEDLPGADKSTTPELVLGSATWNFKKGDDSDWKAPGLDDSSWQKVQLPDTWEHHSNYTQDNVYGWFRRRIQIPADCKGKDFDLLLGKVDDVDETFLNGVKIGGTGTFPPNFKTAWDKSRRYHVPASLVHGDGTDLIAVRVFDGTGDGGMYAAGSKDFRVGPFDTGLSQNGGYTAYTVGGTGWYRKHFIMPQTDSGKQVSIRFDGVYMNSDVWINGHLLGNHPYGYTGFEYDLTPYLKSPGQDNVLAVRVRNEGKNSRWYSGSGIYRHTWLSVRNSVYVLSDGVIVTMPQVSEQKASLKISTNAFNSSKAEFTGELRARILDPDGKLVGSSVSPLKISAKKTSHVDQSVELTTPALWSPDSPKLYSAEIQIVAAGKVQDSVALRFGVRSIQVDAENGFRINGKSYKLKGGCVHHDNGLLGAVTIDRAEERRVELLKAPGYNAIRTSHNPPSPAFLDACDKLGMLVLDEAFDCWNVGKNSDDYHVYFKDWAVRDITSMVRRDRNHPSVVMWSIGNEIPEQFSDKSTAKMLREAILTEDTTRPVAQAICSDWGVVAKNWETLSDTAFKYLDIGGYNYLRDKYESDHARNPKRVIMGTESYPQDFYENWVLVEKHPYVIGDFVWTSMDYFGESGVGHAVPVQDSSSSDPFLMPWPWHDAWCGDIDVCGFKKPQSYYRDVVWNRSAIEMEVHVPLPQGTTERVSPWGWPDETKSWTWPGQEAKPLRVNVYTRCDSVRLELNGKVIAEKPVSAQARLTVNFELPYQPGELRAVGLTGGKPVATAVLRSTGAPKSVRLTPDRSTIRANRNDLCYVTVEIVDAQGAVVPNAAVPVRFSVTGAGELAAAGNPAPDEPASFQKPQCTTWRGRGLVILRPKGIAGAISLKAEAVGLEAASLAVGTR